MRNINDADFLADACLNNPSSHIRLAIFNRICDEGLLDNGEMSSFIGKVIMSDPDEFIVTRACEKLNFSNSEEAAKFLAGLDWEALNPDLVKGITDEYVLNDLALNHSNEKVRSRSVLNPCLTDTGVIAKVISKDRSYFTRISAIARIRNCSELAEMVYKKSLHHRLTEIANNIAFKTDNYFINEYESADDEYKRQIAVMFIEDESVLEKKYLKRA